MDLIPALRQRQAELKLTDAEFATELGVSRPMWVLVRNGSRQPGTQFLQGVMRRFPMLTDACMLHIRDNGPIVVPASVTNSNSTVTDGT